jgi:hypothetical protein
MGLNQYVDRYIFDDMLVYCKFPDDLFVAPEPIRELLRRAIERTHLVP